MDNYAEKRRNGNERDDKITYTADSKPTKRIYKRVVHIPILTRARSFTLAFLPGLN